MHGDEFLINRAHIHLQEREHLLASQKPRLLRSLIRAANRLALCPRDRHLRQRNTSDHSLLRCLMLGKTLNVIPLRQLSFRRFRLARCSQGYRMVWRLHQVARVKASNQTRELWREARVGRTDVCARKQFGNPSNFGLARRSRCALGIATSSCVE